MLISKRDDPRAVEVNFDIRSTKRTIDDFAGTSGGGLVERRPPEHRWRDVLEKFEPLSSQRILGICEPGHVATRSCETRDESVAHWVHA